MSWMSNREPEPRTAVMVMVEATWADQNGTLHKCSATMENTSRSGARIRLRNWEHFTGTTRYCRSEGRDYLVGI